MACCEVEREAGALSEHQARQSDWASIFRIPSGPAVNAPQRKGRIHDCKLYRCLKSVFLLQHRGRPYMTMPGVSIIRLSARCSNFGLSQRANRMSCGTLQYARRDARDGHRALAEDGGGQARDCRARVRRGLSAVGAKRYGAGAFRC